jgi:hypothetical protein
MERRFENALNVVLTEMKVVDEDLCCAVYWDDICADNAMVMFMEYPYYKTIHDIMRDLHKRLSKKLGHPVCLCHNHPTDENILIHGGASDAEVYYADECCKRTTISGYHRWVEDGRQPDSYRQELRSLFYAVETVADGLNKSPEYVLQTLDWDKDPQAQMIQLLIDYHN